MCLEIRIRETKLLHSAAFDKEQDISHILHPVHFG
jgi:hypothetical protein